jgi:transposase
MKYKHYIGIDISKLTLDISVIKDGQLLVQEKIDNTTDSIQSWLRSFRLNNKASSSKMLFCWESIGLYQTYLANYLNKRKLPVWIESPLRIKRSLGIQRGKNDKIDSFRIAEYAWLNRDRVLLAPSVRPVIEELKRLNGLRTRLMRLTRALTLPVKEEATFQAGPTVRSLCFRSIQALETDLKETEAQIDYLIKSDERLNRLFEIITSIYNIGRVVAIEMIIATNEFKNFSSAKKFACYIGIAPFEYQSGTSLKSKGRVSKIGNRRVKRVFHMPALTVTRGNDELAEYYKRKLAQGHAKLSVINAIKNKLIYRIFACVKEDRLYQYDLTTTAGKIHLLKAETDAINVEPKYLPVETETIIESLQNIKAGLMQYGLTAVSFYFPTASKKSKNSADVIFLIEMQEYLPGNFTSIASQIGETFKDFRIEVISKIGLTTKALQKLQNELITI